LKAQEEIWFAKGEKAYNNKNYAEAIKCFTEAIKAKPDIKDAYYMRGLAFMFVEESELAEKDFTKVIELDSNDADAYNNRGLSLSYQQQVEESIKDFAKAVDIDSNFSLAYLNLGSAYLAIEEFDNALNCMNRVVKLDSNNAENYFIRGTVHYYKKHFPEAIEDFTKSLNLGLKTDKTFYNRANSYFKVGRYQDAINDFNEILKMNPYDLEALNNRAIAYGKVGMKDEADEDKLKLAEIYTGIEKLTDINKLKFKKYTLLDNLISIELPSDWMMLSDTSDDGGLLVVCRDSITDIAKHYIAGVRIAFDNSMKKQYDVETVEEILNFWEANADSNKALFRHHEVQSKEPLTIDGYRGFIKKVYIEYNDDTFQIILYEIVLAKPDKLIYMYFQSPKRRFDYYKKIFDKALKTIKINL